MSWGSTWSVQTLTKKGLKICVSYFRNDTTTYESHQGHSQVFWEKTDQTTEWTHSDSAYITGRRTSRANSFFYSAFIYVKSSSFLHGRAPPRKQMRLIAYWKSWKDICTYCLPASISHAQKKPMACWHTPTVGPILLLLKVTKSSRGFTRKAIAVFASKIKPFVSIPRYLNYFKRLQHSSRKAQVTTDAN